MKTTKNSIILTNQESYRAGHHRVTPPRAGSVASREIDRLGGEIRQAAHDLAKRKGCRVEVFATRRKCQPWLIYACDAEGQPI